MQKKKYFLTTCLTFLIVFLITTVLTKNPSGISTCDKEKAFNVFKPQINKIASDTNISKENVANLIKTQGQKKGGNYYLKNLSYELVNLDADNDLEIVAKIISGIHIGDFFIFDKKSDKKYHLVVEKDWKIDSWDFSNPIIIDGKKIFKIISRSGGTGISDIRCHLWYIEDNKFIEAWQGRVKERMVYSDDYYLKIGSYQYNDDNQHLYAWVSNYKLKLDAVTPKEKPKTTTMIYKFDGNQFVLENKTECIEK